MKTDWMKVDNYWRYFYSNGEMARDAVIDGYVINRWGIWAEGITPNEVEYSQKLASGRDL